MIAVDTSSLVAYLQGDPGGDVDVVDAALADKRLVLPPIVLAEILSDPRLPMMSNGWRPKRGSSETTAMPRPAAATAWAT